LQRKEEKKKNPLGIRRLHVLAADKASDVMNILYVILFFALKSSFIGAERTSAGVPQDCGPRCGPAGALESVAG